MNAPKRQFLAEFELYVMLAVVRLAPEAYGAAIRREIECRTGRSVSIGALYATLGRLEDKGLLVHRASHPLPVKGGRSRKYYEATPAGETVLTHSAVALNRMMDGLGLASDGEVV
jgi:DNA-binding PadR family transcriptional regulator